MYRLPRVSTRGTRGEGRILQDDAVKDALVGVQVIWHPGVLVLKDAYVCHVVVLYSVALQQLKGKELPSEVFKTFVSELYCA